MVRTYKSGNGKGLPKRKAREIVFQLLYSQDIADQSIDSSAALLEQELSVGRGQMRAAQDRVEEIHHHQEEIDKCIRDHSKEYEPERIQRIERNILRLGLYEMLFDESIPSKVAISEALRLAKKFSTPESVSFVNALLDDVRKEVEPEEEEEDKSAIFFGEDETR